MIMSKGQSQYFPDCALRNNETNDWLDVRVILSEYYPSYHAVTEEPRANIEKSLQVH